MDLGFVAVADAIVGLTRREVEGAGDLLVEENVAHWLKDVRIKTDRKFADVARAGVAVEDFVETFRVVGRGLDDAAFFENETDVIERRAEINRGGVVLNDTLDRILDRAGK
jgi:hypothetical protein